MTNEIVIQIWKFFLFFKSSSTQVFFSLHLFCFISNVYKQRLFQRVDIFEIAKQLNPFKNMW